MPKYKFSEFRDQIEDHFEASTQKAFLEKDLRVILDEKGTDWNVPKRTKFSSFLTYLLKNGLVKTVLSGSHGYKTVYSWKTDDELTIISRIRSNSYYSHFMAMFLNNLTQQIPKTYYLNYEHSKAFPKGELTQESIDKVFSKGQRKSTDIYSFLGRKIILTNGKQTGRVGIIDVDEDKKAYSYTNLERTLIDIAIRPAYSGGVFEVLNAYQNARGIADCKRMKSYLSKLDYLYPYHQVIGFYLENAGYPNSDLKVFEEEKEFDFYLTYNIRQKEYSDKWRLFYPKGINQA